jgi:hypothetical protein
LGVSGGKDSLKLALFCRNVLGLNPLLVTVACPPEQASSTGIANLVNLTNHGFDVELIGPSPKSWKLFMKRGLLEKGNLFVSTEKALFSGVPKLAIEKGIPLILWGENVALQTGDAGVLGGEEWDGNSLRNTNTLSNSSVDWFRESNLPLNLIEPYIYPSTYEFEKANLQIVFVGWAIQNWGLLENGVYATLSGLQMREDKSISSDFIGISSIDEDFFSVNQMLRYYKFGFARTTEYVNEWIRKGRISRNQGKSIVEKFDGKCSDDIISSLCNYLDLEKRIFWETVHKFTNQELFEIIGPGRPTPKFKVGELR